MIHLNNNNYQYIDNYINNYTQYKNIKKEEKKSHIKKSYNYLLNSTFIKKEEKHFLFFFNSSCATH